MVSYIIAPFSFHEQQQDWYFLFFLSTAYEFDATDEAQFRAMRALLERLLIAAMYEHAIIDAHSGFVTLAAPTPRTPKKANVDELVQKVFSRKISLDDDPSIRNLDRKLNCMLGIRSK